MKLTGKIQNILNIPKSTKEQQTEITVTEAWHLWQNILQKYDIIELTQILQTYANDADLRAVLAKGLKTLQNEAKLTESQLKQYGIIAPRKAPPFSPATMDAEPITDEFIFRRVYFGMQGVLPMRMQAFIDATSPTLREIFREHMNVDADIYDALVEYGKLKGYIEVPPSFRV